MVDFTSSPRRLRTAGICAFLPLHRGRRRAEVRPIEASKAAVRYVRSRRSRHSIARDERAQSALALWSLYRLVVRVWYHDTAQVAGEA